MALKSPLRIVLTVVAAASFVACGRTRGAEKLASQAAISLSDAIGRAIAQVPGGIAVEASLEQKGDRLVYSIDVAQGNRTVELHIDATDGHVVKREEENEDYSREASAAVTLAKAVQAAAAAGKPVAAKIEKKDGNRLAVKVDVVSGGKTRAVEVDAATGELAEVKS